MCYRCTRTESPPVRMSPACKLSIKIIRTPYRFVAWTLWPIVYDWGGTIWWGDISSPWPTVQFMSSITKTRVQVTTIFELSHVWCLHEQWWKLDHFASQFPKWPPIFIRYHKFGHNFQSVDLRHMHPLLLYAQCVIWHILK